MEDDCTDLNPNWRKRLGALCISVLAAAIAIVGGGVLRSILKASPNLGVFVEGLFRLLVYGGLFGLIVVRWLRLPRRQLLGWTALNENNLRPTIMSALLGVGAVIVATLLAVALGGVQLSINVSPPLDWATYVGRTALGVTFEELAFRCGMMGIFYAIMPRSVIAVLFSLPFAILHFVTPEFSFVGLANTVLLSLAIATLFFSRKDGGPDWWPAIGFHFGWNLTLALTGSPVSGNQRLLLGAMSGGSRLWSGGEYGLEASIGTSIAAVAALAGAFFIQRWRASNSGLVEPRE